MELLAPVFALAGIAAAAVPLILHMLRRTPAQRLPFSLVRFLQPNPPRLTRRSTVEHWPLLLLRILAVVLLGMAFARPFQRVNDSTAPEETGGRHVTLLIDRSASMHRSGLRDAVIGEIREVTSHLNGSDQLRVVLFSDTTQTVISQTAWSAFTSGEKRDAVERLCEEYAADWQATRTGLALQRTVEELTQNAPVDAVQDIVLVTDFQEGSDFRALQSMEWPRSVQVDLRIVSPEDTDNASLHTMVDRRTGRTLIRVNNDADAASTDFELQPQNADGLSVGPTVPVTALPGRQVTLPVNSLALSDEVTQLALTGDRHEFDNIIPLPVHRPLVTQIAHVGSTSVNDADDMRYYLQRALDGMVSDHADGESDVTVFDSVTADGLVLPVDDDIELVVLTDAVPDELLPSLRQLLDRGGVLVAALRSTLMAESIRSLLPQGLSVSEASVDDYAMLGRIDFEHPLFAEFSDGRFADFSSIRFWKHRSIQLPTSELDASEPAPWTVIARFDSGMPAIVRIRDGGSGELWLLASGWHPDDSQWALSSRFAPMLAGFRQLARPPQAESRRVLTGDAVNPAELCGSDDWRLRWPDGTVQSADERTQADELVTRVVIDQPGTYRLSTDTDADAEGAELLLLAEVVPDESRTAVLPQGQLYALGLAGEQSTDEVVTELSGRTGRSAVSAEELEARQDYWRWFLLAGLFCLVAEALLAAVLHRRQSPETA